MDKVVLHHISSDFGKNSSIGYRSKKIIEYIKGEIKISVICRSNKSLIFQERNIWTIDLSYLFSNIFNFIRIYLFSNFPSRKYELFIFNFLSIPYIFIHYIINIKKKRYFHSWDTSLWLLILLKKLNYFIIRDCAMTPSKSSLIESKKNPNFYEDKITNHNTIIVEKRIFNISDLIISPSEYTTNFINNEYQIDLSKLKTVPFGANLNHFKNNDFNLSKNEIIKFGFVGLVNMRKGIRWLVQELNDLYEKDKPKFELHLFGRIFKEEAKLLKNAKFKIIRHGFVDKSKNNIYSFFNILIHPSFIEGSAKCIYEAMASGLPIICTRQSGSIVQNKKNGFVINAGDSINLKKALIYFINNKKEIYNMGINSKKIIKNYSWDKYAENVIKNYYL